MITSTMRRLVPEELITPLTLLGKYDWLRWTPIDSSTPHNSFELRLPSDSLLLKVPHVDRFFRWLQANKSPDLWFLYAVSKALAEGTKLLCPSTEQCQALEHVDVNVSFDDYVQPFPTFLIELPEGYRQWLTECFRVKCPELVLTHHDARSKYIISWVMGGAEEHSTEFILTPRFGTIEEALRSGEGSGNAFDQSEVIQRVALNFGLLMTHFGVRNLGPVDRKSHDTHLRNARRKNQAKAERARRLLDAEINLIEFEQDVVVYDKQETTHQESDGEGTKKRPHWRRGHFRRQPYGHARSFRRLIFVKPILINSHRFQGDFADTEYRLRLATQQAHTKEGGE